MLAYFVSDIHLRSIQEVKAKHFVHLLKSIQQKDGATHLFLVGDIFDLWLSDYKVFLEKWEPIIKEIQRITKEGIAVHYFEGNHDLYLQKYWGDRLGVKTYNEHAVFKLGPYKVRVEHGDLIDPDDKGYLFLRKVLRSETMQFLIEHTPESWITGFGERASRTSRYYTSSVKTTTVSEMIDKIRNYAHKKVRETEFDFIVSGHVHVRDEYSFAWGGKKIQSINLGSWFDEPMALKLTDEGYSFVRP